MTKAWSLLGLILLWHVAYAQDLDELSLEDPEDINLLLEDIPDSTDKASSEKEAIETVEIDADPLLQDQALDDLQVSDDLEVIKEDLDEVEFILPEDEVFGQQGIDVSPATKTRIIEGAAKGSEVYLFDVGEEEKKLLAIA